MKWQKFSWLFLLLQFSSNLVFLLELSKGAGKRGKGAGKQGIPRTLDFPSPFGDPHEGTPKRKMQPSVKLSFEKTRCQVFQLARTDICVIPKLIKLGFQFQFLLVLWSNRSVMIQRMQLVSHHVQSTWSCQWQITLQCGGPTFPKHVINHHHVKTCQNQMTMDSDEHLKNVGHFFNTHASSGERQWCCCASATAVRSIMSNFHHCKL